MHGAKQHLVLSLTGPENEVAAFADLFAQARRGDCVDLALMARRAQARQPQTTGSIRRAPLKPVVSSRPFVAERCEGPFMERVGKARTATYFFDAADDCSDELRALTHSLPSLTVEVTAWTSQRDGILTVSHAYRGGKRRLTMYQEAA